MESNKQPLEAGKLSSTPTTGFSKITLSLRVTQWRKRRNETIQNDNGKLWHLSQGSEGRESNLLCEFTSYLTNWVPDDDRGGVGFNKRYKAQKMRNEKPTYRKRALDKKMWFFKYALVWRQGKQNCETRNACYGGRCFAGSVTKINTTVKYEYARKHESMWDGHLGVVKPTEHRINLLEQSSPFNSAPFLAGPKTRKLEEAEVNKQIPAGVIEHAQSEWAAPVLFAAKKDGRLCFCVEYRPINAVCVGDTYLLPLLNDFIDSIGTVKIFSTVDVNSGYWKVPVHEEDCDKTSSVFHDESFRYKRM